jgi:hypothetical protein
LPGKAESVTFLTDLFNGLADKPDFYVFSFWGTIILSCGLLVTVLYLIVLRLSFLISRFRLDLIETEWNEVFKYLRRGEEPADYPGLSRAQKTSFLEFWLNERRHADARYGAALDALAQRLALHRTVVDILHVGPFQFLPSRIWLQSIATESAAFMDRPEVRRQLFLLSESDDEFIALQACVSLARLRAPGHEKRLIALLFKFPARVAGIFDSLAKAGSASVLHIVRPFLPRLPSNVVLNFIQLSEESGDPELLPMLIERLQSKPSNEETAALLRAIGTLGSHTERTVVLPYLKNESAYVRLQSAKALGYIGLHEDIEVLMPLLWDIDWWVRYRAARSIIRLMDFDQEELETLREQQADVYAQEILTHAFEEMKWYMT